MDLVSKVKHDKLVEITFNEEKKLYLSHKIFREYRLREGEYVDLRSYLPKIAEAQRKEAFQKAISLLAVKDRSTKEIQEALILRKYSPSIQEYVLQRLTEERLLNDSTFASSFAKNKLAQGLGKQRILQDLAKKGIAKAMAEQALAACNYESEALLQAKRLAERYAKRYPSLDRNSLQKIKMALFRKGFSMDMIQEAVGELEILEEDEWD